MSIVRNVLNRLLNADGAVGISDPDVSVPLAPVVSTKDAQGKNLDEAELFA